VCGCVPPPKKTAGDAGAEPGGVDAPVSAKAGIYYFFDRTASMRGFAAAGENSGYVTALPAIWGAAESCFPNAEPDYYEYGQSYIYRFEKSARTEVKKPGFYDTWIGEKVYESKMKMAFQNAKDFIEENNNNAETLLYIITSDLYEQNAEKSVFSEFYRALFARGRSGAIFAIESRYSGNIFHEASGNSNDSFFHNGKSLFFVLVAGNRSYVRQYHAKLREDFKREDIQFESWLFDKNENYFSLEPQTKYERPEPVPERKFNSPDYMSVMAYLREEKNPAMLGLYGAEAHSPARVTAYQIQKEAGARYVGFLPKELDVIEFKNTILGKVESCRLNDKRVQFEQLEFKDFNEDNFKIEPVFDEKIQKPALTITINNTGTLAPGIYKVNITSCVKAPQWISERSVAKLTDLKKSLAADRDSAKVLNLEKVFEDIADRYVSSGAIYFVKKR
jgi:hypothetical protein